MKSEKLRDAVTFLQGVFPFNQINEAGLTEIAERMAEERFAPNEVIIKQGMRGFNFYVIRSGLMKVFITGDGEEKLVGFIGEGDCFGEISLLQSRPTTANIQAIENTVCLIQPREYFLEMVAHYKVFESFFDQLLTQRLKINYRQILSKESGVAPVESYIYMKQVKELMAPGSSSLPNKSTIREAAAMLLREKRGVLVVVDNRGCASGIVGLRTIAQSILFEGVDPEESVLNVVERKFEHIDAESYFFDALHSMTKNKINMLVVTDKGKATGMLTGFDLLRFRGRETLSLLRNIEKAPDLSQLNSMRDEVEKVLRQLMADGALASHACKIVSEFNDRVVRRIIEFAEEVCGRPPVPYTWLGLGSEGRKEQTLFTDQDNAIIFSDEGKEIEQYFMKFSGAVVDGLNRCGIPLCKGNVMATNPKFSGSLATWKARIAEWITSPDLKGEEIVDTYVFLDFRSLHGDSVLEKELKEYVFSLIRENPLFLRGLARSIVSIPMPIGFFKHFIVEKSGEHKNRLNLKLHGLVPLVTCVKILGLHGGATENNTLERIKSLAEAKVLSVDQKENLEQAFETFLTLKIRNNLAQIDQVQAVGNYINPAELSTKQKQLLKEAFWAVSELQKTTQAILKIPKSELGLLG